jgi:hypothetical protein
MDLRAPGPREAESANMSFPISIIHPDPFSAEQSGASKGMLESNEKSRKPAGFDRKKPFSTF